MTKDTSSPRKAPQLTKCDTDVVKNPARRHNKEPSKPPRKRFVVTEAMKAEYPHLPDVGTLGAEIPDNWDVIGESWVAEIRTSETSTAANAVRLDHVICAGSLTIANIDPVVLRRVYVSADSALVIGEKPLVTYDEDVTFNMPPSSMSMLEDVAVDSQSSLHLHDMNCVMLNTDIEHSAVTLRHGARIIDSSIGGSEGHTRASVSNSFLKEVNVKENAYVSIQSMSQLSCCTLAGMTTIRTSTLLDCHNISDSNINQSYLQDCMTLVKADIRNSTMNNCEVVRSEVKNNSSMYGSTCVGSVVSASTIAPLVGEGTVRRSTIEHSTVLGCYIAGTNITASMLEAVHLTGCSALCTRLHAFTATSSAFVSSCLQFSVANVHDESLAGLLQNAKHNTLSKVELIGVSVKSVSLGSSIRPDAVYQATVADITYTLFQFKDSCMLLVPSFGIISAATPRALLDESVFHRALDVNATAAFHQAVQQFINNPSLQ